MKILITNYGNRFNKGTAAILHAQINSLKEKFPSANFWIFTYYPDIKNHINRDYIEFFEIIGRFSRKNYIKNIKTLFYLFWCIFWRFMNYLGIEIWLPLNLKKYYLADLIIDTGGDGLTEDYGTPLNIVTNLLFGIFLKKKVVIYAESIGLFKKWYNRFMVRYLLNRVVLITVRDEISIKNINKLGVKKPIFLTADPAFLLNPITEEKVKTILSNEKTTCPFVGFSVSKLFSRYKFKNFTEDNYKKYILSTIEIINYINNNLNMNVVFIPHVIDQGNDDRVVAEEILKLVENKEMVFSIKNEYSPEELKGIIGKSEIFIGARMHSCIASTSMEVPTIAIAYSHKTYGIIGKMLGYDNLILDISNVNLDSFKKALNFVCENKEKIKKDLKIKISEVKNKSLKTNELIKKI